jgi:tetratricopeptide (TPR) repeat protein
LAIAYNILGLILDRQRKANEAIAAWTKGLQLDPAFALAHGNIGVILTKQRQVDLATIKYRQAIRVAPNFYLAHYNLGAIFLKQGKRVQAQVHGVTTPLICPACGGFTRLAAQKRWGRNC